MWFFLGKCNVVIVSIKEMHLNKKGSLTCVYIICYTEAKHDLIVFFRIVLECYFSGKKCLRLNEWKT